MTYSESARGVLITAERAHRELERHGLPDEMSLIECLAECEEIETPNGTRYDAGEVLDWLGY